VRTSTAQLLSSWGCRVHPAASFESAVGIAADRRSALDLVIADYRLPGARNGAEAIGQLREILGWTVPAILVTGESNRDALGDIRLERVAVAIKPFHPAKLRALVSAKLRSGAPPPRQPAEAEGGSSA
jgi:DNA-binding response OmpR family regulator